MSKGYCTMIVAGLLVAVSAAPTLASDWSKSPLGRAEFGEVWEGPPLTISDLAGKVVLVQQWRHT